MRLAAPGPADPPCVFLPWLWRGRNMFAICWHLCSVPFAELPTTTTTTTTPLHLYWRPALSTCHRAHQRLSRDLATSTASAAFHFRPVMTWMPAWETFGLLDS
ncbi:unnamed protein product [Merluccius merluccius]